MSAREQLAAARYINLRSFRRDGTGVNTPVWCAPLDDSLVLFTLRESYKVKRIARDPRVQVAQCDVRGKLLGPWHQGRCRAVIDEPELEARAYRALRAKYGLQMAAGDFFSRLAGRMKRRLVMQIVVDGAAERAPERAQVEP
ncbi:MAG: PPOX class F420-dependent oxidoreductase [Myxococcales bacterium]|nr:PPOX class F420-dependent oxidoreductase [Myxococcales bacterium]